MDVAELGKVPREVLEKVVFRRLGWRRKDVIVFPRFGEDAAVLKLDKKTLVAAMDPITGSEERIGWLSVHVNANDVAVMGAEPRWFSATILLPEDGLSKLDVIMKDIDAACRSLRVSLVTGHTEVASNVSTPIVIGHMLGVPVGRKPVTSSDARPGDVLVMSKSAGIEGTAILASAFREKLAGKIPEDVLARAEKFYEKISIVREALKLAERGLPSAMHDPTEGGVATALREIASASQVGMRIKGDALFVNPETALICEALKVDPLGLISSGALLITCAQDDSGKILSALEGAGIKAACIGEITDASQGLILEQKGRLSPLPQFPRDELARFFSEEPRII